MVNAEGNIMSMKEELNLFKLAIDNVKQKYNFELSFIFTTIKTLGKD